MARSAAAALLLVILLSGLAIIAPIVSANDSFGPDDFSTNPFAGRWDRNDASCVVWNSGPQNVDVGRPNDFACAGFESVMSSPGNFATTGGASDVSTFSMSFTATLVEETGATGGPDSVWFGFRDGPCGVFDGSCAVIALRAQMYLSPNCVTVEAFFRYSDTTESPGTESACALAFNTVYSGTIGYDGPSRVLTVTLGSLTVTNAADPVKTMVLQKAGFQAQNGNIEGTTIDDVSWSYTTPTGGAGGPGTGLDQFDKQFKDCYTVTLIDRRPEATNGILWVWNWGDGSPQTTTSVPEATHAYAVRDIYTVQVRVQDRSGSITTFAGPIDLTTPQCEVSPIAQILGPYILALMLLTGLALLIQAILGKPNKYTRWLLAIFVASAVIVMVFFYYGWNPSLPGGIQF